MALGECQGCGCEVSSHCNMCDECARAIEYEEDMAREQFERDERERWEREQMEEHFRKHPHG